MSAVAFFRLKCDGGCDRWLSDILSNDVARLTKVRGRALTFATEAEAEQASITVGWTKHLKDGCMAVEGDRAWMHSRNCEVAQRLSLCGNCRAKKETETDG